jgi:hypothetical protein
MSWLYNVYSFLSGEVHPAWFAIAIALGGIAVLSLVPGALPFLQFWWGRLPGWAKFVFGGAAIGAFLFFLGRYKGTQDTKAKQAGAEAAATKTRLKVTQAVNKMTPAQREAALSKYYRKDD